MKKAFMPLMTAVFVLFLLYAARPGLARLGATEAALVTLAAGSSPIVWAMQPPMGKHAWIVAAMWGANMVVLFALAVAPVVAIIRIAEAMMLVNLAGGLGYKIAVDA